MTDEVYDAVVVGGGAAGLSAALILGRARRRVLVIDGGEPRNAPADGVHAYLGREGAPPAELLAAGREEVRRYGVELRDGTVVSAERDKDREGDGAGFRIVLGGGSAVRARRLLVATGLTDELPRVPGLAEGWGTDVLHCPYCHGWEVRDQPLGVLSTGPLAVHQALLWRQWSEDVTLFLHTGPEPDDEEYEQLAARGVAVVDGTVEALERGDGAAPDGVRRLSGVRLAGGTVVPCRALAVAPRFAVRAGFLAPLGLEPVEAERDGAVLGTHLPADATGQTPVDGVWVAGNAADPVGQVIGAAAAGTRAAAALNADLVAEETRRAPATRAPATGATADGAQADGGAAAAGVSGSAEEFWDERYGSSGQIWSGRPNAALVRETGGLSPSTALDLGCGEGGDAIWLARQGWRVTAADLSRVALDRAAAHAEEAGVADRVEWQHHDLGASFPSGSYGLVSAQFFHSLHEMPREEILRRAAEAVAPGGVLLVVGHMGFPSWETEPHPGIEFPTPQEVLASLALRTGADGEWEVLECGTHEHPETGPDGGSAVRVNYTVKTRRRP